MPDYSRISPLVTQTGDSIGNNSFAPEQAQNMIPHAKSISIRGEYVTRVYDRIPKTVDAIKPLKGS